MKPLLRNWHEMLFVPSHYMGVVEMYRATGNPRYLELSKNLIDIRGMVENGTDDNQDRIPFRQQYQCDGTCRAFQLPVCRCDRCVCRNRRRPTDEKPDQYLERHCDPQDVCYRSVRCAV